MISAYAIGTRVWLVPTRAVAQQQVPGTLSVGSVILEVAQAKAIRDQLSDAITRAERLTYGRV